MGTSTTLTNHTTSDIRRILGEELARKTIEEKFDGVVDQLLGCDDPKVVLDLYKFLFDHAYGKARQRQEVTTESKRVNIRFDIGNKNITKGEVFDVRSAPRLEGDTDAGVPEASRIGDAGRTDR